MNTNPTHPYTLDVSKLPDGRFQWAIRRDGKLFQRSDRTHDSEQGARKHGHKVIEALFREGVWDSRRR